MAQDTPLERKVACVKWHGISPLFAPWEQQSQLHEDTGGHWERGGLSLAFKGVSDWGEGGKGIGAGTKEPRVQQTGASLTLTRGLPVICACLGYLTQNISDLTGCPLFTEPGNPVAGASDHSPTSSPRSAPGAYYVICNPRHALREGVSARC